jgi:acetyl-CoA acetyltransferase
MPQSPSVANRRLLKGTPAFFTNFSVAGMGPVGMEHRIHAGHRTRYGLQTMCEGGGTANATLVELVE